MKKLAIIGSGDLARLISFYAIDDNKYEVVGFFDDFKNTDEKVDNKPILGKVQDIPKLFSLGYFDYVLMGIGYNHLERKKDLFNDLNGKVPFGKLIHSSCMIASSSIIGDGAIIFPGCIIDDQVVIKENVLLNLGCCVAHNSIIGGHSFIAPRVAIAGFVETGECCFLGINTTIIDNIKICGGVQTGGNSTIIKDVEKVGLYVGSPARLINKTKHNDTI